MISVFQQFVQYLQPWQFTLVAIFLQIGLLVGLAWLVCRRLDHLPRDQHFIWLAALVAICCALPLKSLMPGWNFEVEQVVSSESANLTDNMGYGTNQNPSRQQNEAGTAQAILLDGSGNYAPPVFEDSDSNNATATRQSSESEEVNGEPVISNDSAGAAAIPKTGLSLPVWKTILLMIYLTVVFWMLARLFRGWVMLRTVKGETLETAELQQLVQDVATQLGLSSPPRVLVSSTVITPLAYGIFRPVVLLPVEFPGWSRECQQVVMTHEFCHVQRRDAVGDLLARLIETAYWFHPAVHFAGRSLRKARETATDQAVLQLGIEATCYARELLNVTAGIDDPRTSLPRSVPALPMAGEQDFETRIKRILRSPLTTERKPSTRKQLLLHGALLTAFLMLIGTSLQMTIANILPQEDVATSGFPDEVPDDEVTGNDFFQRVGKTQIRKFSGRAVEREISVSGVVLDSNSKPASRTIVILRNGTAMSASGDTMINDVVGKTWTDDEGRYELPNITISGSYFRPEVVALATTGEMGWSKIFASDLEANAVFTRDIKMFENVAVSGQLTNEKGEPVANAKLNVISLVRQTDAERRQYVGFNDRVIAPSTVSDANGKFEFPAIPAGYVLGFTMLHPHYPHHYLQIRSTDKHQPWLYGPGPDDRSLLTNNGAKIEIEMGVTVGGKVVDENGSPLADISLEVLNRLVVSDAEGNFQVLVKKEYLQRETAWIPTRTVPRIMHKISSEELQRMSAVVQIHKPIEVSGKVLDADDKSAISGVTVRVSSSGGVSANVTTNQDGRYSTLVVPGDVTVTVVKSKSGFESVPRFRNINQVQEPGMIRKFALEKGKGKQVVESLLLQRAESVEVLIVDEAGEPIQGAQVCLWSPTEHSGCEQNSRIETTLQDGICELTGMSTVSDQSFVVARAKIGEQEFISEGFLDQENGLTKLTLQPAVKLSGKVTRNGESLSGIEIRVSGNSKPKIERRGGGAASLVVASREIGKAATNENGEYSFYVPRTSRFGTPGAYTVGTGTGIPNPQASGTGERARLNDLGEYIRDIEFVEGDGQISGTVVDSNGDPVQGVYIGVTRIRPAGAAPAISPYRYYQASMAYSDHEGKFSMIGLPEGKEIGFRSGFRSGRRNNSEKYVDNGQSRFTAKAGDNDIKIVVTLKD